MGLPSVLFLVALILVLVELVRTKGEAIQSLSFLAVHLTLIGLCWNVVP
jgi:hypothetical protein